MCEGLCVTHVLLIREATRFKLGEDQLLVDLNLKAAYKIKKKLIKKIHFRLSLVTLRIETKTKKSDGTQTRCQSKFNYRLSQLDLITFLTLSSHEARHVRIGELALDNPGELLIAGPVSSSAATWNKNKTIHQHMMQSNGYHLQVSLAMS